MQQKLRIRWIAHGVSGSWTGGWTSPLASNRYRVILPATALRERGHDVELIEAEQWQALPADERADVVVLGKLLPGQDLARFRQLSQKLLEVAHAASAADALTIGDFNDDHFQHPLLGEHWRAVAGAVDLCTVGSDAMAAAVRGHTQAPVAVVGDPLGSPARDPKVFSREGAASRWARALLPGKGSQRLKFVWYGNPGNWPAMQHWALRLQALATEQPFVLWIVSQPVDAIASFVQDYNSRNAPNALAELVAWDEQTQWDVVADADIVLIPSDPHDPKKAVKTSNRLADALHAGRYVIASPLPSYAPFADFVALTDDPTAAVRDYLADSATALSKLMRGQATARARCGLPAIADEWERAFRSARRSSRSGTVSEMLASASPAAPVRLNLGCGDKILPGYINVDVVAARAGKSPDVTCDLRDLSCFESGYADEVLAVHVVEHFWRWEVEAILREWVRVLKPGGRMVLECPNLKSACEAFLADPDAGSRPDQAGQRTMWVFYGDPRWNDPLMVHRWGYTPGSLAKLMESVGLINARQEAAQYKLREPRDMRLVAEKPL